MKYGFPVFLALVLVAPGLYAESIENNNVEYTQSSQSVPQFRKNPRPGGGGGFGGPGFGGHHGRHPSQAQRQAFESCMAQAGVQLPARPQFTEEQKAAFEQCRSQGQGPEGFHQCMQNAGITPPPRPHFDSAQLQALQACRNQAKSQQ